MIGTIATAAALMVAAADCPGRANFSMACLGALNKAVAKQLGVNELPNPQVLITNEHLGGAYGHAAVRNGVILLNPKIKTPKNFHVVHELVHVYQRAYGLQDQCGKEIQAQKVTSAWCRANNCPVHEFDGCERKEK